MNKLQYSFFAAAGLFLQASWAFAENYQKAGRSDILVGGDEWVGVGTEVTIQGNFLTTAERYISGLLAIVAVGVFIYLGFKLFTAHGNEEEFKKAWTALSYAVIGLAVVPLSYVVIKVVLGFTL